MGDLLFNGASGRKPQTEARIYVYRVLASMLDVEKPGDDGWMFGGVEMEPDERRILKAMATVRAELLRKAAALGTSGGGT